MNAGRSVKCETIVIVIPAGGQAIGKTRFCRECDTDIEETAGFDRPEEIQAVAVVELRSRPLSRQIVIVCRK